MNGLSDPTRTPERVAFSLSFLVVLAFGAGVLGVLPDLRSTQTSSRPSISPAASPSAAASLGPASPTPSVVETPTPSTSSPGPVATASPTVPTPTPTLSPGLLSDIRLMLAADTRVAASVAGINVDLTADPRGPTLALHFQALNQIVGQGLEAAARLQTHPETAALATRFTDAYASLRQTINAALGVPLADSLAYVQAGKQIVIGGERLASLDDQLRVIGGG